MKMKNGISKINFNQSETTMTDIEELKYPLTDIERAIEMQKRSADYPKAKLPEAAIRVAEKAIAEMRVILRGKNKHAV